ncbi:prephenate dehydratase [Chondrinema litorale]|uniref:prephenate dehydratase n=1 Tax=Chondrinema litorale TaxID=2994555 RepID=UPI002542A325|nr:prephenate dehydratase [Chondrinema litorale]UZR94701.1 prephenate dehydratase [Chondrinema litorale]
MDLNDLRNKIDSIDDQLLTLLNERMQVVKSVGELKRASNAIIYRPEREKAIVDRLESKNKGLLSRSAIEAIFLEIFAVSRNMELPERIAFLGPEGSFTHQAAESRFGATSEYVSLKTIKSVFESVDTERVRFGVVPVENNQQGSVIETIDLLGELDVKIVAEMPMPIHFTFASKEDRLEKITKIYSKDIAFRQCRKFIVDYFGEDIPLVEVASTSKATQLALENEGTAAICSHIAAKLYDLPVLFENIEDSQSNFTRFLIISKNFNNQKGVEDKTSILLKTSNNPGALALFLKEFEDVGINLTKLESRPAREGDSFKYWFLVDFDGHYLDDNVQKILKKHEDSIRFLGSYVKLC